MGEFDVSEDQKLSDRLDAFVVYAQGQGADGITRSSVIRTALEGFLDAAERVFNTPQKGR